MLIKPTSVPELGTVGPTDTESVVGVTPLVGLTMSQLLLEKACAVKFRAPVELVICSGCAGANAPLKTSWGGYAVSVELCARAVSMEHKTASIGARANKSFCSDFTVFSKQSRKLWLGRDAATGDFAIILPRTIDRLDWGAVSSIWPAL